MNNKIKDLQAKIIQAKLFAQEKFKDKKHRKDHKYYNGRITAYDNCLEIIFKMFPEIFGENNTKFNEE